MVARSGEIVTRLSASIPRLGSEHCGQAGLALPGRRAEVSYASPCRAECSVDGNHEQEHHPNCNTEDDERGATFSVAVCTARHRVGDQTGCSKTAEHERDEGKGDPPAQRELECVPEPVPVPTHVVQAYLRRNSTRHLPGPKGPFPNTGADDHPGAPISSPRPGRAGTRGPPEHSGRRRRSWQPTPAPPCVKAHRRS